MNRLEDSVGRLVVRTRRTGRTWTIAKDGYGPVVRDPVLPGKDKESTLDVHRSELIFSRIEVAVSGHAFDVARLRARTRS